MRSTAPSGPSGLSVAPFRPVTYSRARAGDGSLADLAAVTAPPYDVIDAEQRAALAAQDPHNVVRLTLPHAEEADPAAGGEYRAARSTLDAWLASGVLRHGQRPALVVYQVGGVGRAGQGEPEGPVTRGLVAAVGLRQPDEGVILPHENTMKGPVADRLALTRATEANLEPIMLAFRGAPGPVRELLDRTPEEEQLLARAVVAGVEHLMWVVSDPEVHEAVAQDLRDTRAVIADGHHRYATSLAYQALRHEQGAGAGPWDRTLAWLLDTDARGPQVGAIHRVLPTLPLHEATARARQVLTVTPMADGDAGLAALAAGPAQGERRYLLTDGADWALLSGFEQPRVRQAVTEVLPPQRSAAWRSLDVTIAHHYLVAAVWGLPDDEDTVWYRHDVAEALAAARAHGGTALLLNPTPAEAVSEVAAAGDRMPRKSTLYAPKPRSGLVMRLMREE